MINTLALVGCGNMGSALLQGWLQKKIIRTIYVICPRQTSVIPFLNNLSVHWFSHPFFLKKKVDCIVFAVKPFLLRDILVDYLPFVSMNTFFLSVAAGKTFSFFKNHLGENVSLVRCMPNTPATIGAGVTIAVAGRGLPLPYQEKAHSLLKALGSVHWFENEAMIDKIGALTGCGPAYLFQFIECLAEAAVTYGIEWPQALELSQSMVIGSAHYLQKTGKSAYQLRGEVTSPQGMTAAALKIMTRPEGLTKLFKESFEAAIQRADEMSKLDES